ncbi:hypothetical protein DFQ26_004336 [Actinomortierella ambigua]|nr:hypothetical protein DFQ26_004327 [Actinomortierella ambigua]KAF9161676.1 hypothetical protein DFQ26_004336 [Actinomortierella ambigua]
MLGLLGLHTGQSSPSTPFFGLFYAAFRPSVPKFTFQSLTVSLAKVLLRPTTVFIIAAISVILFDFDEWDSDLEDDDDAWEEDWQDDDGDNQHLHRN